MAPGIDSNLFTYGPGNVSTLLTTTNSARHGDIKDGVFNEIPTLSWLMSKGKASLRGGATILTHIRNNANSTASSYAGYDIIDTTPQDEITTSQAEWKQYAASISVSGREERIQNAGKEAVFDLVRSKLDGADRSLRDKIAADLFASSQATKAIRSLVTLIDATSTVQDINSTTYSFWQADSNSGGSFAAQGLSDMRTLWNALAKIPGKLTDLIVTTSDVHGYYEGALTPQQRYQQVNEGNASFMNLMFKSAPVIFDNDATSGVMYFLNSDVMDLVISSDTNFVLTDWVKPAEQDAKVAQLLVGLELVTTNRRKLGKITSVSA